VDADRFDQITRTLARQSSRRAAFRCASLAGLAAGIGALTSRSASAQESEPAACVLQLHAETATGPNEDAVYDGVLALEISTDGSISKGTFTAIGVTNEVTGQAIGKAISLRVDLGDGQALSLHGVSRREISLCRREIRGIFGGPGIRDLGTWAASRGTAASDQITPTAGSGVEPTPTQCPPQPCERNFQFDSTTCECSCPSSQIVCNDYCCPNNLPCDLSTGDCSCPPGSEFCGGSCLPTCPPGQAHDPQTCECVNPCPPGQLFCGTECVDSLGDPSHCGTCDTVCPADARCVGGVCTVCASGYGCYGVCCVFHEDLSMVSSFVCVGSTGCFCDYVCSEQCASADDDIFTVACELDPKTQCFGNCAPIVGG
jgi:hypothetical protein